MHGPRRQAWGARRCINNFQKNMSASSNRANLQEPYQVTPALRERTPDAKRDKNSHLRLAGRPSDYHSAPKGNPTRKYTLNGWGQTEADFAFSELAHEKADVKTDGWRTDKITEQ